MQNDKFIVSLKALGRAFNEWDRRYTEERDRFDSEINTLLNRSTGNYGLVCALYLLKLVNEDEKAKKKEAELTVCQKNNRHV